MKRLALVFVFCALVWTAARVAPGGQGGATPRDEYTFETSRLGFEPIAYPGPLNYLDMVRLLLRREGDFHLPLTRHFRAWRRVDQAEPWTLDFPHVLKVHLGKAGIDVVAKPSRLRLGVHEVYNLPLVVQSDLDSPTDLKVIATLNGEGPTDRWTCGPGATYVSLNLLPKTIGKTEVQIRFYAGQDLPPEGSPPESRVGAETSLPAEVVGWGTLRLHTVEGGSPVVARTYVRGSDGLAYAPAGANGDATLSRITWTAGDYYFYSRGDHEIRLPEGPARLEAVRGIEYRPVNETVEIRAGQTTDATLELRRHSDLAAEHWYGGDVHIHANYNNHEFITPRDVKIQVLGEDLNVANLVVANSVDEHIHDEQYFEGKPHQLSDPTHILYWVEEMRNRGLYGHMCLTGLKALVKPLYTGFEDTPYPHHYPPNHVQALEATRQGGAASYAHPGYRFTSDPKTMSARELPVDLALGSVQAMDVLSNSNEEEATPYWYRLLNTGLKCSISAGTDSFTNRRYHWIPGGHRVYVYTGGPLEYQAWVDNYRAGRSFATNGPILRFTVNGKLPGTELALQPGDKVQVEASATCIVPMNRLEVIMNGEVVATAVAEGDKLAVELSKELQVDSGAWLAARVRGGFHRYVVNDTYLYAHSSPVYCTVAGRRVALKEDGAFSVNWIDQLIAMVEKDGRFASAAQKQEVVALFRKGRAYYEKVVAAEE